MRHRVRDLASRSATVQVLRLRRHHLDPVGWTASRMAGQSVEHDGRPLPWWTYPTIALLERRLPPAVRVFEWGSGNSTLWWSNRGAAIHACEHDPTWFERATGGHTVLRALDDGYVEEIRRHENLDVVVIDGRRRVDCAREAVPALGPSGVIIWDNSERARYQPGITDLVSQGFKHLPLEGIAPGLMRPQTTSIFYRAGNLLDL